MRLIVLDVLARLRREQYEFRIENATPESSGERTPTLPDFIPLAALAIRNEAESFWRGRRCSVVNGLNFGKGPATLGVTKLTLNIWQRWL